MSARLHRWMKGEVDISALSAICRLVEYLEKQEGSVEELERALSQANAQTKCITIQRRDSRIGGHFAHLLSCRVWRWPDLAYIDELEPLDLCEFSYSPRYSKKKNKLCVNPYHYGRVEPLAVLLDVRNPQVPCTRCEPVQSYIEGPPQLTPGHYRSLEMPAYSETVSHSGTIAVKYQEPPYWCSVLYYELNKRVGEVFRASSYHVVIDGFTDPCTTGGRFCLGQLSSVYRNSTIENTRSHIGKGVHLVYVNGKVFANCFSDNAIFGQSMNTNHSCGFHPNTVCKISPGCSLMVFNDQEFASLVDQSVEIGYEAVYKFTEMCTIRLSFVEGWGAEYDWQYITSTPCWIEIRLNGPLKLLDNVLSQMGNPCNSDTN